MITLLGSLLGFLAPFLPEVLKAFNARADRAHELAVMTLQMQAQREGANQRLEEIGAQADIAESAALYKHAAKTGVAWVDALGGLVRPTLTFAFFAVYAFVKWAQMQLALEATGDITVAIPAIWHDEDRAIFATIIAFWFGQRAMAKARAR